MRLLRFFAAILPAWRVVYDTRVWRRGDATTGGLPLITSSLPDDAFPQDGGTSGRAPGKVANATGNHALEPPKLANKRGFMHDTVREHADGH